MRCPRLFRYLPIATFAVLVGCGGPADDGTTDSATDTTQDPAAESGSPEIAAADPCAVLTAGDVLEVTGSETGTPGAVTPVEGGVSYCNWPMAGDTSRTIVTVMAFPAPAMTYEEYLDQTRSVLEEGFDESDYEPVAGVGSAAVWSGGFTLQAWGKGHMVQIQSGIGGPALDRDQSADLAQRALERL